LGCNYTLTSPVTFLPTCAEVLQDVRWYLAFLGLIVLGYSMAFHVLFRKDQKKHEVSHSSC